MQLTIYLSKQIPDRETGLALIVQVKQKLIDHPDISVTADISEFVPAATEPEPPE